MKFGELEIFDEFVFPKNDEIFYVKVPLGANVSPFNAWDSVHNEYIWLDDDIEVRQTAKLTPNDWIL